MKRQLLATGSAMAIAAVVTAAAQTPSTPSIQSSPMNQTLTMTGCVKATDELALSPTQNSLAGAWPAGEFVLTNATATPATTERGRSRGGDPSGAGRPASESTAPMPPISQYVLRPADTSVNVSSHVNRKVEVTARLAPPQRTDAGIRAPGAPALPATLPATDAKTAPGATAGAPTDSGSTVPVAGMPSMNQGTVSYVPTLAVTAIRQVASNCG